MRSIAMNALKKQVWVSLFLILIFALYWLFSSGEVDKNKNGWDEFVISTAQKKAAADYAREFGSHGIVNTHDSIPDISRDLLMQKEAESKREAELLRGIFQDFNSDVKLIADILWQLSTKSFYEDLPQEQGTDRYATLEKIKTDSKSRQTTLTSMLDTLIGHRKSADKKLSDIYSELIQMGDDIVRMYASIGAYIDLLHSPDGMKNIGVIETRYSSITAEYKHLINGFHSKSEKLKRQ